MKVTQITATVSRTVSLAPYETAKVEFMQTAELSRDDDVKECREKLWQSTTRELTKMLENEIAKGLKEIEKRKKR